jgi:nicotinamide riboside kinase
MAKLAFIGTHGVGKTTLCYDLGAILKKRGLHVDLVKEVARLSPLPINRKTSLEAQMWILTTQIAEEIRSAAHHEVVVCDRSVLDNYAYLVFAAGRQRWLEPLVNRWMKTYDLLFKVPISGTASADGVRDTDEFFMRQIDRLVDELVEERGLPCERLPEGWREDWADIVKERSEAPAFVGGFESPATRRRWRGVARDLEGPPGRPVLGHEPRPFLDTIHEPGHVELSIAYGRRP